MSKQAFIQGFVKRAQQHGLTEEQAITILKQAAGETDLNDVASAIKAPTPVAAVVPPKIEIPAPVKPNMGDRNDRMVQPGAKGPGTSYGVE